jgi:deoxyribodipyrimidine photo-lyase
MSTVIWWVRRDLRLSDNQALSTALREADVLIPLFILDLYLLSSPYIGSRRLAFLYDALRSLNYELRSRGSALIVRRGEPLEVLRQMVNELRVQLIVAEADVSPYARRRDARVRRELPLTLVPGVTVHPPENMVKPSGAAYSVYTPFSRMWHSLGFPGSPLPAPDSFPPLPVIPTQGLPSSFGPSTENLFPASEVEAQRRLKAFIDLRLGDYAKNRDCLDLEGTSGLSPYLRFGMLSARSADCAVREAQAQASGEGALQGPSAWQNELIWREFYAAVLYHFPFVRKKAFRKEMRAIQWLEDAPGFAAWAEGSTGYPVVDAAMRQMQATGWMHNRARMIAASFLTKDLLINWRKGERFFMQHLIDGDPAANNGGWQWAAGTGTDAAPYFRVLNPVMQGKKFDPHGAYVRRWVPELTAVPDEFIHDPWKMPAQLQARVNCRIGKDYPAPIVDHAMARQRALEVYRRGAKR